MLFTQIWVLFNTILYLGIGCLTLFSPMYVAQVIHFELTTPGAIAEFRAMYGGLQIALAAIMFILYRSQQFSHALAFIAIIYLGFGSGRLIGIITNQAFDRTTMIYFSVEVASVIISLFLYHKATKFFTF